VLEWSQTQSFGAEANNGAIFLLQDGGGMNIKGWCSKCRVKKGAL